MIKHQPILIWFHDPRQITALPVIPQGRQFLNIELATRDEIRVINIENYTDTTLEDSTLEDMEKRCVFFINNHFKSLPS